jgi:hypothetical protein
LSFFSFFWLPMKYVKSSLVRLKKILCSYWKWYLYLGMRKWIIKRGNKDTHSKKTCKQVPFNTNFLFSIVDHASVHNFKSYL